MEQAEAQKWAETFENKSISELLDMPLPEGASTEAIEEWWQARARAIEALEDAEDAAAETTANASDGTAAEELALAREEQAQQCSVVSRASMFSDPAPALDDIAPAFARPQARAIRNEGDTEHLLNGLIAECHLLMRAVTLPSAMRAGDADTRQQFLRSAMDMAKVGAKVGRAVAKLRGAGNGNSFHQKVTVEHAGQVGGGDAPRKWCENVNSIVPENRQKRPNWRRGAPNGNRNALKHGRYTKEARALRARIRDFKQRVKIALALVDQLITTQSPPTRGEADNSRSEFRVGECANKIPHPDRFALRPPHKGEVMCHVTNSPSSAPPPTPARGSRRGGGSLSSPA